MEALLAEHRERENNLRDTLLTAQRLSDEIKEAAQTEAKLIVREAQGRADMLLQKAQVRLEELDRDINELKLRRRDAEGSVEATIQALYRALEFIRDQDHAQTRRSCSIARARRRRTVGAVEVAVTRRADLDPARARSAAGGRRTRVATVSKPGCGSSAGGGKPLVLVKTAVPDDAIRPDLPDAGDPRAGRTATRARENPLMIRLASAPVDGAANDELTASVARAARRPKRQVPSPTASGRATSASSPAFPRADRLAAGR